jgi:hypothetical protein
MDGTKQKTPTQNPLGIDASCTRCLAFFTNPTCRRLDASLITDQQGGLGLALLTFWKILTFIETPFEL